MPEPRFSHISAFVGTNLVIFGGINRSFCAAELFALELDPYHSRKAIKAEQAAKHQKNKLDIIEQEEFSSINIETNRS